MDDDDDRLTSGPYKGARVEFASHAGIDELMDVAEDFISKVLDFEPGDYVISDESMLSDFGEAAEGAVEKTMAIYGVDISDLENSYLVEIFRRVKGFQRPD